jgi:hypothetical protein
MNQERQDEAAAKRIVERVMGIQLIHADTHGGVDYISPDATVALEVTAVTDGGKQGARAALSKSKLKGSPTSLHGCWIVMVAENQPGMKHFVQRVQPAIAELEFAGETHFERQHAMAHAIEKGELADVYLPLLKAGVERAEHLAHQYDPDHVHSLLVSIVSGGSVSGSDESLDRLMKELNEKPDNPTKLLASRAEQRHLFVWLNGDTWYNIARPLSREAPSSADRGWGLPTTKPQLDPAITHLWVVHSQTRMGWLWNGGKWRELRE